MELPSSNKCYGEKEYWDDRYSKEDEFDWFTEYRTFRHYVLRTVKKSDRILHLGCGNSSLSAEMFADGYHNIVNVDYSPVVIDNMRTRYQHLDEMEWLVLDARDMSSLDAASFDVVLEKGTIDAMLVDERDVWRLSDDAENTIDLILCQISRLLKPNGGRFISVTFAQPHFRIPLYVASNTYDWNVTSDTFGDGLEYFYYTMTKGLKPSESCIELRCKYEKRKKDNSIVIPVTDSEDEDFLLNAVHLDSSVDHD